MHKSVRVSERIPINNNIINVTGPDKEGGGGTGRMISFRWQQPVYRRLGARSDTKTYDTHTHTHTRTHNISIGVCAAVLSYEQRHLASH